MFIRTSALLFLATLALSTRAADLPAQIDEQIDTRLTAENLSPAPLADDAEFIRRLYLDLHGVVPTLDQTTRFLADTSSDKRAKLVDALLADARYGQNLADIWADYLLSPLADDAKNRSDRFRAYLANQFHTRTWDKIASDLVTATGKMEDNAAVTYLIEGRLPRGVPDLTDLSSRYFLGLRLNCVQCHDHPSPDVKWKQADFWGMAAFFTQIQTPKRAKQVYEKGVVDDPSLTLATLKDAGMFDGYLQRPPTFLGGQEMTASKSPNRAALAKWITAPQNSYFARAAVNRTWWRLFGRGIVDPVDDMHDANSPSHSQLLQLLTQYFIDSGYDHKAITRAIVLSRAYQRTSRTTDSNDKLATLFGRMSIKVLSAGQLYDSLETICGPATKVTGIDAKEGARWEFTQFFGESGDPDPRAYRRGIPHLLRQMNSGQFAGRNLDALVSRLSSSNRSPEQVAGDLFLAILSRQPTPDERKQVAAYLESSPQTALRELAWVLLMTSEFSLNH